MKKGFVFDLDGVITDTAEYHFSAWRNLADSIGIEIDRHFNEQLKGISRMESLERILIYGNKENDFTKQQKLELAHRKNAEYLKSLQSLNPNDLLPGVKDFFSEIKKINIPCSLASASLNAPFIIEKLAIKDYFDGIVDPGTLKHTKPHPEIYIKGAEILRLNPRDCIGFEDAPAGIQSIKTAGMYAVGIESNEPLIDADLRVFRLDELSVKCLLRV